MPKPPKALPKATAEKITAWSYSRLNDYIKCPKYAYFKHVRKLKEPGNKYMERGSMIDQMESDFIKGTLRKRPPEIATFEEEFLALRKAKNAITQEQWAFNAEWKQTDWFADDAWLRAKTDIYRLNIKTNILLIVDCKTGKQREEHDLQLDLYALLGLLKMPTVDAVDSRIWYTDMGIEMPAEEKLYTQADVPKLKKFWMARVKPMMTDTRFKEKPSNACSFCFFSKAKGGPCKN